MEEVKHTVYSKDAFPELREGFIRWYKSVKKKEVTHNERKSTFIILRKFFYYAVQAAIHGYPITSYVYGKKSRFEFEFRYIYIKNMPKNVRKINFSPKAFGYLFVLYANINYLRDKQFWLEIDPSFIKDAIAITESDKVYDLIKQK